MRIIDSANRHGVSNEDLTHAWEYFVSEFAEHEDPVKVIRLGFDTVSRLLEVGAVVDHTGEVVIIHAMTARPKYTRRIGRRLP
ncbi:toxin [Citricoccus zhacaiensis]